MIMIDPYMVLVDWAKCLGLGLHGAIFLGPHQHPILYSSFGYLGPSPLRSYVYILIFCILLYLYILMVVSIPRKEEQVSSFLAWMNLNFSNKRHCSMYNLSLFSLTIIVNIQIHQISISSICATHFENLFRHIFLTSSFFLSSIRLLTPFFFISQKFVQVRHSQSWVSLDCEEE